MVGAQEIVDEAKRVRKVTHIVDITATVIRRSGISRREAAILVAGVREEMLRLFRDDEQTYEVVYARRVRRLVDECSRLSPERPRLS